MTEKETVPPSELPMDEKIKVLFDGFYSSFRAFNSSLERSASLLSRSIVEAERLKADNVRLSHEVANEIRRREEAEAELKEYKTQWVSGWSMCCLVIIVGMILFALK